MENLSKELTIYAIDYNVYIESGGENIMRFEKSYYEIGENCVYIKSNEGYPDKSFIHLTISLKNHTIFYRCKLYKKVGRLDRISRNDVIDLLFAENPIKEKS